MGFCWSPPLVLRLAGLSAANTTLLSQVVFHSTRKRRGGEEGSRGRLRTVVAHGSKKAEEGLKRIDAALDALLPYGFSKETICSTINKLLKVYDDNAAWYLIEEGSYSLVIETILEEQKQEAREEGRTREEATASRISSNVAQAEEPVNWKDISSTDLNQGLEHKVNGGGQPNLTAREVEPLSASSSGCHQNLSNQFISLRPRRLPCYGWISEDEDEE
ncbi:unnamed protein product [Musa acuminata subsp. burmannicoides]